MHQLDYDGEELAVWVEQVSAERWICIGWFENGKDGCCRISFSEKNRKIEMICEIFETGQTLVHTEQL